MTDERSHAAPSDDQGERTAPVVRSYPYVEPTVLRSAGAGPALRHDAATRRRIQRNLDAFDRQSAGATTGRPAAVTIALMNWLDLGSCFVITRRPSTMSRNAGQWSLPGGRVDDGEEVSEAARRELQEELGVEAGPQSVLGTLDPLPTISGFMVDPVVLWLDGTLELKPNPSEVEAVFIVPIGELLRPDSPRYITRGEGRVMQLPMGHRFLYPPTAAILFQFVQVGLRGTTTRVGHLLQPTFTRD